jgi:ribosomal protein S24E
MVNMSYSDVMSMPTYERKYFINKLVEELNKKNEEYEKRKK